MCVCMQIYTVYISSPLLAKKKKGGGGGGGGGGGVYATYSELHLPQTIALLINVIYATCN